MGSFVRNEIQQQTKSAMLTFSYFKTQIVNSFESFLQTKIFSHVIVDFTFFSHIILIGHLNVIITFRVCVLELSFLHGHYVNPVMISFFS